jgi:hypothetical protein
MPFLFCCAQDAPEKWISSVHSVLQEGGRINIPEDLRQALLLDDIDDFAFFTPSLIQVEADTDEDAAFLLKGLPRRPLHVELGNRLSVVHKNSMRLVQQPLVLPAAHFGLEELPEDLPDTSPSPTVPRNATKRCVQEWINKVGTRGILRILGMRSTIGTDPRQLLPPSWTCLLEAASVEKRALSVAARARAKHAHRGKDHFFGLVTSNADKQNKETYQIVLSLLRDAAWINIHTFSGTTEPVLEVRVASGYGARWKLEANGVSFRGFLEPQMSNGHERKWRH